MTIVISMYRDFKKPTKALTFFGDWRVGSIQSPSGYSLTIVHLSLARLAAGTTDRFGSAAVQLCIQGMFYSRLALRVNIQGIVQRRDAYVAKYCSPLRLIFNFGGR